MQADLPQPVGAGAAERVRGRTAVVTGANAGLGLATATALASMGMKTLCVCRSRERGEKAVAAIKEKTGNDDVHLKVCDVSSLSQLRELAASLQDEPVHVLVNNAGVLINEAGRTEDGLELSFATNTLGTFAATELLLPSLKRAASDADFAPRVVAVSSGGMYSEPLEVDDLQNERLTAKGKKWDGVKAYAYDKRRQVALTEKWAAKYADTGVKFVSMHPGWADTPGVQTSLPDFRESMQKRLRTNEQGADTIVWLAAVDTSKLQSGEFYLDRAVAKKHLLCSGTRYSDEKRDLLYERMQAFLAAPAIASA